MRDAYGDVVRFFGENGNRVDQFHGCCNPIAIDLLSDGRWVTAEKGLGTTRVKIYDEEGKLETIVAGPDQFDEPSSGPPIVLDIAVHPTDPKSVVTVYDGTHQGRHVFKKTSWEAEWQDITPTTSSIAPNRKRAL